MTDEKAIEILNSLKKYYNDRNEDSYVGFSYVGFDDEDNEALDMAIKALEQTELNPSYNSVKSELNPCEDYISRTELLSRIDAERKHLLDIKMDGAEHVIVHHARRIIEDMPSLTPQQTRWIPVSEKPQEGRYLCTYEHWYGKCIDFGSFDGAVWYIKPIAYMPLPEPYKAESEE
jgi:hypothetical protein